MALAVQPADHHSDRQQILNVLERNLPEVSHARRYEWLYTNNPTGKVTSWFLVDSNVDHPVGMVSLFPRFLYVHGKMLSCGQVGNFAIDMPYRTLGPAVMLQRTTFEPVRAGALDVCYDCPPHELGMAPFRRLGMRENCEVVRYARLIRTDRQFEKRIGSNPIAATLSAMTNAILKASSTAVRECPDLEISVQTEKFDEGVTALDDSLRQDESIRMRRSAGDLNWRFRDDPLSTYTILAARRRNILAGFAIYAIRGEDAWIVDVQGDDTVRTALVRTIVQTAHTLGAEVLSVMVSAQSPLVAVLDKLRFRLREERTRVVAFAANQDIKMDLSQPNDWNLTGADILA